MAASEGGCSVRHVGKLDLSCFEDVLAAARRGNEAAWSCLYDSLAAQVLGYLRSRGAVDAEEVLGDTFLHVARGIDDFEGDERSFRSWVFVIATSRLYDDHRRRRRRPAEPLGEQVEQQLADPVDVDGEVQIALAQEEVQRLLGALTAEQRSVVELRVFGELTSQEVADAIGKPLTAVKALYLRGLGALRRQIEVDAAQGRAPFGAERLVSLPVPVSPEASSAVTRGSQR